MKKQVKVLTTIIMVIMVIATLSNVVLGVNETLTKLKTPETSSEAVGEIQTIGSKIVGILQVVGIVVAVVVLLVVGIKYMMGSAEEKAEYKKVMIPYIVGAILIFAATTIVNVVYNLANGLNN